MNIYASPFVAKKPITPAKAIIPASLDQASVSQQADTVSFSGKSRFLDSIKKGQDFAKAFTYGQDAPVSARPKVSERLSSKELQQLDNFIQGLSSDSGEIILPRKIVNAPFKSIFLAPSYGFDIQEYKTLVDNVFDRLFEKDTQQNQLTVAKNLGELVCENFDRGLYDSATELYRSFGNDDTLKSLNSKELLTTDPSFQDTIVQSPIHLTSTEEKQITYRTMLGKVGEAVLSHQEEHPWLTEACFDQIDNHFKGYLSDRLQAKILIGQLSSSKAKEMDQALFDLYNSPDPQLLQATLDEMSYTLGSKPLEGDEVSYDDKEKAIKSFQALINYLPPQEPASEMVLEYLTKVDALTRYYDKGELSAYPFFNKELKISGYESRELNMFEILLKGIKKSGGKFGRDNLTHYLEKLNNKSDQGHYRNGQTATNEDLQIKFIETCLQKLNRAIF